MNRSIFFFLFFSLFSCAKKEKFSDKLIEINKNSLELQNYIDDNEAKFRTKPDNQATIIWNDTIHRDRTNFCFLYLHGFSGSLGEGKQLASFLSKKYKSNLFLSRLSQHGLISDDPMLEITAQGYWESAKFAFCVAKQLGRKVIILSTSTGGTLALMLAARYREDIAAVINMSPNIRLKDKFSFILNYKVGLYIAKMIMGGDYKVSDENSEFFKKYWYKKYRVEALLALQKILTYNMNEQTFSKVSSPTLNLYYDGDDLVDVEAIKNMHKRLGSSKKYIKNFTNAKTHTIGTPFYSKDYQSVKITIVSFLDDNIF